MKGCLWPLRVGPGVSSSHPFCVLLSIYLSIYIYIYTYAGGSGSDSTPKAQADRIASFSFAWRERAHRLINWIRSWGSKVSTSIKATSQLSNPPAPSPNRLADPRTHHTRGVAAAHLGRRRKRRVCLGVQADMCRISSPKGEMLALLLEVSS